MRLGTGAGIIYIASKIAQQVISKGLSAPSGLTLTDVSGDIKIDWVDNASAPQNEDNYLIERSADGISWSTLTLLAADTITYTDTTPLAGSNYYRVKAVSAEFGDSNFTDPLSIRVGGLAIGTAVINSTLIVTGV